KPCIDIARQFIKLGICAKSNGRAVTGRELGEALHPFLSTRLHFIFVPLVECKAHSRARPFMDARISKNFLEERFEGWELKSWTLILENSRLRRNNFISRCARINIQLPIVFFVLRTTEGMASIFFEGKGTSGTRLPVLADG